MDEEKLRLGLLKGKVQVAPDFDAPLPPDVQASFERAVSAGEAVHEPRVKTRVQAALEAAGVSPAQPAQEHLAGEDVALFVDIDGCLAPQGSSRVGDRGELAGEGLFQWWPQLEAVLNDFPHVRVVLHSSWVRLWGPLPYLKPLLPPGLAARVVGTTSMDEHRRAHAVQDWVDAHAGELGAYVVLDDRDDFPSHVTLVHCDPQRGLSDPTKVQELRAALVAAENKAVGGLSEEAVPQVGCVIFMDLDGVTHSATEGDYWAWLEPLLQVLEEHPDVGVVIHSSWRRRYGTDKELRTKLPKALARRFTAATPRTHVKRQDSIEAYIAEHQPAAWVVLDDEPAQFSPGFPLVACDPERGLSDPAVVERLRAALAAAKQRAKAVDVDTEAARQDAWRQQRSRALTEAAIEALHAHPERFAAVAKTLERWTAAQGPHTQARAEAWRRVLHDKDWDQVLEDSEQGRWLRTFNPLVSALDQQEREAIWERFHRRRPRLSAVLTQMSKVGDDEDFAR